VIQERRRIKSALEALPVEATDSQANFLWLRAHGVTGDELATRLEQSRVLVAPGGPLGDEQFVRIAVCDPQATARLLWALGQALEKSPAPASSIPGGEL
jgi:histidinol-phosphate/aromatic aminotransferase/cobyric acid decarboxylase-like protein